MEKAWGISEVKPNSNVASEEHLQTCKAAAAVWRKKIKPHWNVGTVPNDPVFATINNADPKAKKAGQDPTMGTLQVADEGLNAGYGRMTRYPFSVQAIKEEPLHNRNIISQMGKGGPGAVGTSPTLLKHTPPMERGGGPQAWGSQDFDACAKAQGPGSAPHQGQLKSLPNNAVPNNARLDVHNMCATLATKQEIYCASKTCCGSTAAAESGTSLISFLVQDRPARGASRAPSRQERGLSMMEMTWREPHHGFTGWPTQPAQLHIHRPERGSGLKAALTASIETPRATLQLQSGPSQRGCKRRASSQSDSEFVAESTDKESDCGASQDSGDLCDDDSNAYQMD